MEETYERRLQQRTNSSFMIVLPISLVNHLGVRKGQSLTFHRLPNKIIIMPSGKELTKKDQSEIERYERILDEAMEETEKEEEKESETHPKVLSTLERLKLK